FLFLRHSRAQWPSMPQLLHLPWRLGFRGLTMVVFSARSSWLPRRGGRQLDAQCGAVATASGRADGRWRLLYRSRCCTLSTSARRPRTVQGTQ
ncbi:hypothetical protein H257_19103, partial [Aphanomyces astaci]